MDSYAMRCLICKHGLQVALQDGANVIECEHCGSIFELEISGLDKAEMSWHAGIRDLAIRLSDVVKSEFIVRYGVQTGYDVLNDTIIEDRDEPAEEYNPRADDSPLWGFDDRLWDLSKRMEETCRELDCLRDEILEWLISMGYE